MKKILLLLAAAALFFGTTSAFAGGSIKMATGSKNGTYYRVVAPKLLEQLSPEIGKIEILKTKGTVQNLKMLRSGEADWAVVQGDSLYLDGSGVESISALYNEYVHLIVRKDSKLKSIKKFTKKNKIAVGKKGSGSTITWQAMCKADKSYIEIPTVPYGGSKALSMLENGEVDGVLIVTGLRSKSIMRAEAKGVFKLAKFDDWDFNNVEVRGKKVYEFEEIDNDVYPNMMGFFDLETIKVPAVLVTSEQWAEENEDDGYDELYDAVAKAVPNIRQATEND